MAKFSEALKTVGKQMDFIDLYNERQSFKEAIIGVIGKDLNGYASKTPRSTIWSRLRLKRLDPKTSSTLKVFVRLSV